MWLLHRTRRFTPEEYLAFRLYEKTRKEKWSFISYVERIFLAVRYNASPSTVLLTRKDKEHAAFHAFYKRDVTILTGDDFDAFCRFTEKHPVLFAKPILGSGGRGIRRLQITDPETAAAYFCLLAAENPNGFILEEPIRQHPEIAKYHPASVNTLRVITLQEHGNVAILTALLRIGHGDMVVDNISAGGYFCQIDPDTGCVNAVYDDKKQRIADPAAVGAPAEGTQIPCFSELLPFLTETCAVVPDLHWIGWDLALTENGWCMVEGNSACQLVGAQTGRQTGMKTQLRAAHKQLKSKRIF